MGSAHTKEEEEEKRHLTDDPIETFQENIAPSDEPMHHAENVETLNNTITDGDENENENDNNNNINDNLVVELDQARDEAESTADAPDAKASRRCLSVKVFNQGRDRMLAALVNGVPQGIVVHSTCACFDAKPDHNQQLAHHAAAPALCWPFGFTSVCEYAHGVRHGPITTWYCNGDVYVRDFYHGDGNGAVRFVMSPLCPDERFRGITIDEGAAWEHPLVTRSDGSLTYVLSHPDPALAPEAFCIYRDYFLAGFLPVEERDREDIAALLARAAERLPQPA